MIFKSAQFLILAALCALCTASSQQGSNLEGSQIARRSAARHLLATSEQASASQKTTQNATVIVVGAGVAGLAAAKRLSDQVTHPQSKPVAWVQSPKLGNNIRKSANKEEDMRQFSSRNGMLENLLLANAPRSILPVLVMPFNSC